MSTPSRTPLRRGRTSKLLSESQPSPSKRRAADAGIYDDFEGAHDEAAHTLSSSKRVKVQSQINTVGAGTGLDVSSPNGRVNPSGSVKRRTRATSQTGVSVEDDIEDAQDQPPLPQGRSRASENGFTPQTGTRNKAGIKEKQSGKTPTSRSKRKTRATSQDEFSHWNELPAPTVMNNLTPIRKRGGRGQKKDTVVTEEGDNLEDAQSTTSNSSNSDQRSLDTSSRLIRTRTPSRKASEAMSTQPKPTRKTPASKSKNRRSFPLDTAEDVDVIATNQADEGLIEVEELETASVDLPAINGVQKISKKACLSTNHLLTTVADIIISKINSRRPTPLTNLETEYEKVHSLVQNTVIAGEGNSMLIIGARGSGKSALLKKVLLELKKDHGEDFHVIRLNGFFQTDDKIALKEIWRQLGKEMEIEDDDSLGGKSYADTLAKLLALLSHPTESGGNIETGGAGQVARAVIFIMDEFDLFATHPRQTLLYNLFDIAQSRKAPIAVIGSTTKVNVSESLEKRVKSRFSHRYVHISLPRTFAHYQEVCKAVLQIQEEELTPEEKEELLADWRNEATTSIEKSGNARKISESFLSAWNASVDVSARLVVTLFAYRISKRCLQALFADNDFLNRHLAPIYYTNKCVPSAATSFYIPVASLEPTSPFLTASCFSPETSLLPPDSKLSYLPTLSNLCLSILIAAARLDIIHNTSLLNFNMAYAEYSSLAAKARVASAAAGQLAVGASGGAKVYGREVARREWELLLELELLVPAVGGNNSTIGGSGLGISGGVGTVVGGSAGGAGWSTQMVRCDVALEEITPSVPKISRMLERWCKQI